MFPRICGTAGLALLFLVSFVSSAAGAETRCQRVLKALDGKLTAATCFESTDLTTNNSLTTPANNSLPGLPAFAFTPITDRGVIAPSAGKRTPITRTVPGLQLNARIASDPAGQARFLLRLPNDWNGRLVVAGASGTRSEFNGDFAWSDYVLQQGYAYASQNKGVLNLSIVTLVPPPPADPLACRLNPASPGEIGFGLRTYLPGSGVSRRSASWEMAATTGPSGSKSSRGVPSLSASSTESPHGT